MPPSTLHLTNAYHAHSGGIRTTYLALLRYAEEHERRMTLVVPGAQDRIEPCGRFTRIVHVRAPRSPLVDGRYRVVLPHRFLRPGLGPLWRLLDSEQPDVVEVSDKYSLPFFAGLIRRRAKQRPALVATSCERLDDNIAAFVTSAAVGRAVAQFVMGRVYIGMFDVHLANSEYTADEIRLAMRAPHIRPVHVCPPGVDLLDPPTPDAIAATRRQLLALCGGRDPVVLLYAGRLSSEKNVRILPGVVAALAGYPRQIHLVIAGGGPYRPRLESEAAAVAPGRVHVLGHLDRGPLWRLLHACDIFIHPNPREPFGLGPLEAMAAHIPVVAPDSGGLRTYASEENAWLGPAHPIAMARMVERCLEDAAARRRRVAAGRQTAEAHQWPAAAARIFAHYDVASQSAFYRATLVSATRA